MKRLTILITLIISCSIWPHGGGLNKDGCHNDRKAGGYHCHASPDQQIIETSPVRPFVGFTENSINTWWCNSRGGRTEFKTKDGTYVDCLTDIYAVEAEFDSNWKEAVGQSLHYAESTNKRAAILFIKQKSSRKDYYNELERVISKYQLPITIFTIEQ